MSPSPSQPRSQSPSQSPSHSPEQSRGASSSARRSAPAARGPVRAGRRPTLADVAALAGVSVTTASYTLNGRAGDMRISEAAASRVRAAAVDLAYRPNRSARNLRTATTGTVGVLTRHVASGQYANAMLSGAGAAALARQHLLLIGETEGDPDLERHLLSELLDRQVDGLLVASVPLVSTTLSVPTGLVPVVLLNAVDDERHLPAVVPDEVGGGRTAAERVTRGRRGVVVDVVGGDPVTPGSLAGGLRMQGLTEHLEAHGHALGHVVDCEWDVGEAFAATRSWLAAGARPEALVCLNDRIAMGVYQALAEHDLVAGRDLSVVSFDGSSLAGWLRPTLTSVGLPYAEMGARAVDLLLSGGTGVQEVAMPLGEGGSVRPAPGA